MTGFISISGEGIEVQALQGLDLLIAEGELTALIGAAGIGKSTLVNIIAGLDKPTAGTAWVAGRNLGAMTAQQRLAYRRSVAGFIWQQTSRNLLPYLTARQNVLLPMRLSSLRRRERRRRAGFLLDTLGITHCADRTPDRMSGGERRARRHRHGAGQRAEAAAGRRAHRRAGLLDRPGRVLRPADRQYRTRSHDAGGHPRPGRIVAGSPDDRDQGRQDEQRDDTATQPPTSAARPHCTHGSTRRWTGRAGLSSRARWPGASACGTGSKSRRSLTTSASGRTRPPIRNDSKGLAEGEHEVSCLDDHASAPTTGEPFAPFTMPPPLRAR